jgi:hypothetical protein
MLFQLKNNHLPINAMILPRQHQSAAPTGTLSREELRRIVADMVD